MPLVVLDHYIASSFVAQRTGRVRPVAPRAVYGWMERLTVVPGTGPPLYPPLEKGGNSSSFWLSPFSKEELVGVLPLQERLTQSRTALEP